VGLNSRQLEHGGKMKRNQHTLERRHQGGRGIVSKCREITVKTARKDAIWVRGDVAL